MKHMSQRYKKALVTAIMDFRTEDDIRKNGLIIFEHGQEKQSIKYINAIFRYKS